MDPYEFPSQERRVLATEHYDEIERYRRLDELEKTRLRLSVVVLASLQLLPVEAQRRLREAMREFSELKSMLPKRYGSDDAVNPPSNRELARRRQTEKLFQAKIRDRVYKTRDSHVSQTHMGNDIRHLLQAMVKVATQVARTSSDPGFLRIGEAAERYLKDKNTYNRIEFLSLVTTW